MSIEQRPPLTIQQIRDLSPGEVTTRLVDLIAEGASDERRILCHNVQSRAVPNISRDGLTDMVASLPPDEQRKQLVLATRLIAVGQREYGAIDVQRDRRDYTVETVEELVDAVVYLTSDLLANGKPSPLLSRAVDLMRDAIELSLKG